MQALLQDRLKNFALSATHISDFVDFLHCGPQSFFLLSILRFPQAPRPDLQYGNAMHETLEWIHTSAKKNDSLPTDSAVHKTLAQRLATKRLTELDFQQFLERGSEALTAYLKQRAHTILPGYIVEYNFRNEGVLIGEAHLGGKIDKLIINKQTKEITIVDYKTGRSHTKWLREYSLHKNRQQLYFYKALVEGSHTFAGYKVVDAYLEFVEPDENGKIQELHLQIDDAEYQHVRKLAQSVWRHIMSLDLPDTTAYTQDLKGIEEFERDLIKE
jgi:ATP-dependent helicase/DNAse subunit B